MNTGCCTQCATMVQVMLHMDNPNSQRPQLLNTPMAIVIAGAIIGISIYFANGGGNPFAKSNTQQLGAQITPTTNNALVPTESPTGSVGIGDDPVLGNPDAPITMIEFSDYECPFCQRHYTTSYPLLKRDYIDTGKVKLVFRDLPLSFHNPAATEAAIAANCAREQGDDATYFRFHDAYFDNTATNGAGLQGMTLSDIASDLSLNVGQFDTCLDSGKYDSEIQSDIADANSAGASATPTFFVGLSTDDGVIEGTRIVGAQPYETVIKPAIETLLAGI